MRFFLEEICRQLTDSSAKALITLVDLWGTANASCQLLKKPLPILTIKTEVSSKQRRHCGL
jgi:hypothetical protein